MYTTLQLERDAGIGVLTLNVPDKRNAMSEEMAGEFPDAVAKLRKDPDVRVVIVTGSGPAFSAGGDTAMLQQHLAWTPEDNRRFMSDYYRAYLSILHLEVPTIAAINGHAIGAGLSMALGCDIRVAAEDAKLGVTYLNLGLHPGMGTTYLLPQTVGYAHAADLIFTGRVVTAHEAQAIGLVSRVVPLEQLMP